MLVIYYGLHRMLSGKHGRVAAVLSWVGTGLVILACGGRVLWNAFITVPPALGVIVGSVVVFRLVRWFLWR